MPNGVASSNNESSTLKKEPPPIVTFDEWTKEKLKMEELKKNTQHRSVEENSAVKKGTQGVPLYPPVSEEITKVLSQKSLVSLSIPQESAYRNYASKECGAKVLFSNDEAENRNAILNEKEADDYMRNPCERAQQKWLIIELCETIQPTTLEIANYELFSSSPHGLRISGSERYPSSDWVVLGEFQAEDTRSIQRFKIAASCVYVKFVRLELLTHHGREHYCTLSLVRVLGVSMVDEYEAEAEAAAAPVPESAPVATQSPPLSGISSPEVVTKVPNEEKPVLLGPSETVARSSQEKEEALAPAVEQSSVKQKDRHLVDAVVDVMGNIGIANIKNVIESAFLRNWKRQTACSKCSSTSLVWMCKTCPASGFRAVSYLFCRAFFRTDRSVQTMFKTYKVKSSTILQNFSAESSVNFTFKVQNRGSAEVERQRHYVSEAQKTFLLSVIPKICSSEKPTEKNLINMTSLLNTTEKPPVTSKPVNIIFSAKPNGAHALPGGTLSHKESVFLKLNKRISALELNMSLSSEYLSELSRRYVEKMNESQKQTEKILKMAEMTAKNAVLIVKSDLEPKIAKLSKEVKDVENLVKTLLGDIFPQQSGLEKTSILECEKGAANAFETSSFKLDKNENVLPASQPHILYSNDHLWTTEQLICMVVLAQCCTVLLMLLAQCCYNRSRFIEIQGLRKVIDEELSRVIGERINSGAADQSAPCLSKLKRKRRKEKKFQQMQGDSGSTASSSLVSVVSRLPVGLLDAEIEKQVGNIRTLNLGSERSWSGVTAEHLAAKSWNGHSCECQKNASEEFSRSASAEELSVQASELSFEKHGHSSDGLQCASPILKRPQYSCPSSRSMGSPGWQLVLKRRRKKLDGSPFKQVL